MNKKILISISVTGAALFLAFRILLFVSPPADTPLLAPTAADGSSSPRLGKNLGKGSSQSGPGSQENAAHKNVFQKIFLSQSQRSESHGTENGETGAEAQSPAGNKGKPNPPAANALPTDADIQAAIDAQNQMAMNSDGKIAKQKATANAITGQIRSLGSAALSPMATDPLSEPPPSQSPPQNLVQATQERKYIAH